MKFFAKFIGSVYRAQIRRGPDPSQVGSEWSERSFAVLLDSPSWGRSQELGGCALIVCLMI